MLATSKACIRRKALTFSTPSLAPAVRTTSPNIGQTAAGVRLAASSVIRGWQRVLAFLLVRYWVRLPLNVRATAACVSAAEAAGESATAALTRATAIWAASGASDASSTDWAARCRCARASSAVWADSSEAADAAEPSLSLRGWTRNRKSLAALVCSSDSSEDDAVRIRLKRGT